MRVVLAVFAHPDDEAYSAGGTLARCSARGDRVHVLSLTRGEGGVDRRGRARDPAALAALRTKELADACAVLGCEAPRFMDLPDGEVAVSPEAIAALLAQLDEVGPQVLLTHGADGAYGHRDHLACRALVGAAAARWPGDLCVLEAVFAPGLFSPLHRALRRRRPALIAPLADDALGSDEASLTVDIRTERARKLAAIGAHASQLARGEPRSLLGPGVVDALLEVERFELTAGAPLPSGEGGW